MDYISYKVIIEHWLYLLCGTVYSGILLNLNLVVCTSKFPSSILPLPLLLSPLITTSLLSASVSLFLFCYVHLFSFV